METVPLSKLKFLKLSSLAVVVSWFLVAVPTAVAEESGSFTMLHSYERNYTVIEHAGGQVTGGSLTGTSTVLQSSGAPFVKGSVSAANCIVFVRMTEAGIDLEAPCTTTDTDGDSLFFVSRRTAGDIQDGGGARVTPRSSAARAGTPASAAVAPTTLRTCPMATPSRFPNATGRDRSYCWRVEPRVTFRSSGSPESGPVRTKGLKTARFSGLMMCSETSKMRNDLFLHAKSVA